MNYFQAVILGVVEGLTEFLPISSTGHLILSARLLALAQDEFVKTFEIAIQLGAILAVIVYYAKSFLIDVRVWKKILSAFVPTAVIGLLLYKVIKDVFFEVTGVIVWAFFLGGVFLIIFEKFYREKEGAASSLSEISFKQAVWIGVFQSLAVVPGVSRAAATIIGGLILGIKRKTIVEFSFLLAVPTMLAATGLDLLKSASAISSAQIMLLGVGFLTSFGVALLSIKFFLRFIQNHSFISFGIYRIALAVFAWFVLKV